MPLMRLMTYQPVNWQKWNHSSSLTPRVFLSLCLSISVFLSSSITPLLHHSHHHSLCRGGKVRKVQWEKGGELGKRETRSKQISVLPGRPPAKVCLGRRGHRVGRAVWRWEGGRGATRNDVIPFIPANKTEWPVRSGSVRAVKFNKVVL